MSPAPLRFQGWTVVSAAFCLAFFAWGVGFYGPGIYIATLSESRGWPVGGLSIAVTFHFLVAAGLVAQLPDWHRRFGVAAVTRSGVVASAAGLLAWGFGTSPWMLAPAAALTGVGWALTSGAAINAILIPWFDRRRPAALAMAYNGASVGGIAMTPFWAWLIAGWGFSSAATVVALLMVCVLWPLAGQVLGRSPAEYGQHADGEATAPRPPATAPAPARSRAALLGDARFRGLTLAFALGLFAQMGLVTHLVSLLVPAMGVQGAGLAMSLVTVFALLGRTATGWVLPGGERRRWAAAATFAPFFFFMASSSSLSEELDSTSFLNSAFVSKIRRERFCSPVIDRLPLDFRSTVMPKSFDGSCLRARCAVPTALFLLSSAAFSVAVTRWARAPRFAAERCAWRRAKLILSASERAFANSLCVLDNCCVADSIESGQSVRFSSSFECLLNDR